MDLFFDVWLELKNTYWLTRTVSITMDQGVVIKIYSGDDLIVIIKEESQRVEMAYLLAAKALVNWAKRNEYHAKSATKAEGSWLDKLKKLLPEEEEE